MQNNMQIGYCAEIAGMTKEDFLKFLGQNKISIFRVDDQKEFLEELGNAQKRSRKRLRFSSDGYGDSWVKRASDRYHDGSCARGRKWQAQRYPRKPVDKAPISGI